MIGLGRAIVVGLTSAAGAALVAGGAIYLYLEGLDRADKWGSVGSLIIGLVGLGIAVYFGNRSTPSNGNAFFEITAIRSTVFPGNNTTNVVTNNHYASSDAEPPVPDQAP